MTNYVKKNRTVLGQKRHTLYFIMYFIMYDVHNTGADIQCRFANANRRCRIHIYKNSSLFSLVRWSYYIAQDPRRNSRYETVFVNR